MIFDTADTSSPLLLAVVQTLLAAQGLEDVRAATVHGARVITSYSTLSLYEAQQDGSLELTLRSGDELEPTARAVEDMLCEKTTRRRGSASTLEITPLEYERVLVDDYTRRNRLCLTRPLHAHGDFAGLIVLHYSDRVVLAQPEFDMLRRFAEFAALALSIARTRADLNNMAYTDALTGLANRRWLEVEFSRLQGSEVSILLIDFDGLKTVNDTLGFDRGDALINAIGAALAAAAKPGEFVVRYGGDEFVLVMAEAGRVPGIRRAEELTTVLDRITLADDLASLFHGASVGSATAAPGEDLWEVLRRASTEMRSRKRRRKTDRELAGHDAPDPRPQFGHQTEMRDRPRHWPQD